MKVSARAGSSTDMKELFLGVSVCGWGGDMGLGGYSKW